MAMQTDTCELLHPFCRRTAKGIRVFPSDARDPSPPSSILFGIEAAAAVVNGFYTVR
jgi:hypothetical protein